MEELSLRCIEIDELQNSLNFNENQFKNMQKNIKSLDNTSNKLNYEKKKIIDELSLKSTEINELQIKLNLFENKNKNNQNKLDSLTQENNDLQSTIIELKGLNND
jgi:chromosome segregation ATPase